MADWNLHDKPTVDPQDTDMLLVEQSDETAKATTVERLRNWLMETAVFSTLTTTVKNFIGAINEHDAEIGDIDVENDGNIAKQIEGINTSLNEKVNKNTKEIVYYVATSGNDNNDGLSLETPFLTIGKAISMIPDFVYETITINIGDGIYNEDILINCKHGKVGLNILGNSNTPTNVKINRIEIKNSTASILVKGVTGISSNKTCFSVSNSTYVAFDNCVCTTQSDLGAFEFLMSKGIVRTCTMSNRFYAILSQYNSSVFISNCTGINNSVVLKALNNGNIGKNSSGTLPEGTTAESIGNGGVIR